MGYVKYKEKIYTKEGIRGRIDKYKKQICTKEAIRGKIDIICCIEGSYSHSSPLSACSS